ncbi:MAG TPA: hypothetical protein PLM53_16230 [Spirochaetota bacterium]|nr:hypothetical protein [Spirochaetota bacterium]HPC41361.1 hypothetical protein [Spirochaetota bacterium]HPL15456.1 hypothetical protein [Spirochaetota bacterium]HQF10050.1 hypothetical protein [Spirochaetota bacterium]HQH98645.1 hypothetical protein [Spirochaetota bacterium]
MNRILTALNLCISGYFIVAIIRHMVSPGENSEYTRMLLFACLGTICVSYMLMVIGGPDRWPSIARVANDAVGGTGPLYCLTLAGLVSVGAVLPLVLLGALGFMLGLRLGLFMVLFFVPILVRLATATSQECIIHGVFQALLFFAAMLLGVGIVAPLEKYGSGVQAFIRHFHRIWPDHDAMSSARMFFAAAVFALANHLI